MGGFLKVKRVEEPISTKLNKQRGYAVMSNPLLNNEKEKMMHDRAMAILKSPVYGMENKKCKDQTQKPNKE